MKEKNKKSKIGLTITIVTLIIIFIIAAVIWNIYKSEIKLLFNNKNEVSSEETANTIDNNTVTNEIIEQTTQNLIAENTNTVNIEETKDTNIITPSTSVTEKLTATPKAVVTSKAEATDAPKASTTSKATATPKATAAPKIVKTETSKELAKSETKYGVIINTYTITTYDVYSDGSKKVKSTKTNIEYDRSGYKASTSELLPEARNVKSKYTSQINEVLKYVNEYRKEANENAVGGVTDRKDLVLDSELTVAACARAMEMAYTAKMTHTRPNGSSCFTILNEMGIRYYSSGENIASGQPNAKSVATSWKNSPGHYQNMISPGFGKIGIGVMKLESGSYYWAQLFTN